MSDTRTRLPEADNADPDGVQVALRAAHTLWSHGDTAESLRWLSRAAESASDEGADVRSLQLAKAAAELRAQLFGRPEEAPARSAPVEPSVAFDEPQPSAPPPPPSAVSYHDAPDLHGDGSEPNYASPLESVVTVTQYPNSRDRGEVRSARGVAPGELHRSAKPDLSSTMMGVGSGYPEGRSESVPPPLPPQSLPSASGAHLSALVADEDELEAEALPDDADMEDEAVSEAWLVSNDPAATQPSPAHPTTVTGPSPLGGAGMLAPPPLPRERREAVPAPPPASLLPAPSVGPDEPLQSPLARTLELGAMSPLLGASGPVAAESDAVTPTPTAPEAAVEPGAPLSAAPPVAPTVPSGPRSTSNGAGETAPASAPQSDKLRARIHHQAVRVSVAPHAHVEGQYVVRPLREGESPGAGERAALLVALEPGSPLV